MKIKEVKGNTFLIDTGMSYIPFYKINQKEIIIFDTGWAIGEREGIQNLLDYNDFTIAGIICSHAHIDHVGNNTYFKDKYKCPISMAAYEAFICSSAENLKLYFNSQTLTEVIEHSGSMICKTDILIMPGQDKVNLKGIDFKIIHTPGHSPAHICIITPDDVAYLGDVLISYEVMKGAKLPYAFILKEDLKSKEKLYNLNCSKYIVAHKGLYDNIQRLISDNVDFYKYRAKIIYNVIENEMTMEEIFKAVIKSCKIKVVSKYRYAVIDRMLKSYVQYLHETELLETIVEDGFLKYYKKQEAI